MLDGDLSDGSLCGLNGDGMGLFCCGDAAMDRACSGDAIDGLRGMSGIAVVCAVRLRRRMAGTCLEVGRMIFLSELATGSTFSLFMMSC